MCTVHIFQCALCDVQCTNCTLGNASVCRVGCLQRALCAYIVRTLFTVHIIQCAMHIIQCALRNVLSVQCGVWAVSPYSPLSVSWADFKTSASAQSRACTTPTSPPDADSVTFTPLITPFGHLFSLQLPLPPSICHGDVGGG